MCIISAHHTEIVALSFIVNPLHLLHIVPRKSGFCERRATHFENTVSSKTHYEYDTEYSTLPFGVGDERRPPLSDTASPSWVGMNSWIRWELLWLLFYRDRAQSRRPWIRGFSLVCLCVFTVKGFDCLTRVCVCVSVLQPLTVCSSVPINWVTPHEWLSQHV